MSTITIRRPDAPDHAMELAPGPARAWLDGRLVAESSDALVVRETGRRPYPPVAYFSREALVDARLTSKPKRTRCPLKGTASYFDLAAGEAAVEDGVWSYEEVLDFDPELERRKDRVAFDGARFRVEIG